VTAHTRAWSGQKTITAGHSLSIFLYARVDAIRNNGPAGPFVLATAQNWKGPCGGLSKSAAKQDTRRAPPDGCLPHCVFWEACPFPKDDLSWKSPIRTKNPSSCRQFVVLLDTADLEGWDWLEPGCECELRTLVSTPFTGWLTRKSELGLLLSISRLIFFLSLRVVVAVVRPSASVICTFGLIGDGSLWRRDGRIRRRVLLPSLIPQEVLDHKNLGPSSGCAVRQTNRRSAKATQSR